MANDPNNTPEVDPGLESVIDPADDTVVDPDLEPYDETVEKPLKDSENFIPSEEL